MTIPPASTPPQGTRRHDAALPLAMRRATRPRRRLGRCLLAETLGLVPTGCPQEAAAEEIEVRAAKHLAFHHFQPVDAPRPGWYSKAG